MKRARTARASALAVTSLLAALGATEASARQVGAAVSVSVSADSVGVAEVFELGLELHVPPGSVVYFPDTIPRRPDLESYRPVTWEARRGGDGGAELRLTYALIPFGSGSVGLPVVSPVLVEAGDDDAGERIPGGSLVGDWTKVERTRFDLPGVSERTIWVEPAYTSEDVVAGLTARGPGDVRGPSWSWPSIALILLFSAVIGRVATTTARDWRSGRSDGDPRRAAARVTPEEARTRAVEALDRLLARGPFEGDRAPDLFGASSGIVRAYVEALRPAWGRDLTSTELMTRLTSAEEQVDLELVAEMRTAEAVKFGRLRPEPNAGERHLRILRAWVSAYRTPDG